MHENGYLTGLQEDKIVKDDSLRVLEAAAAVTAAEEFVGKTDVAAHATHSLHDLL